MKRRHASFSKMTQMMGNEAEDAAAKAAVQMHTPDNSMTKKDNSESGSKGTGVLGMAGAGTRGNGVLGEGSSGGGCCVIL